MVDQMIGHVVKFPYLGLGFVSHVLLLAATATTATTASASCRDVPPDPKTYSCAQQKSWGKCDARLYPWMVGHCCLSCFGCKPGCGGAPYPGCGGAPYPGCWP